jgi:hypothetical protein
VGTTTFAQVLSFSGVVNGLVGGVTGLGAIAQRRCDRDASSAASSTRSA